MPIYIPPSRGSGTSGATSITGAYTKAEADSRFVHNFGNETVNGNKNFTGDISASSLRVDDGTANQFASFDSSKNLVGSGYVVGSFALSGHSHSEYALSSSVVSATSNLQTQITNNLSSQVANDQLLQQQINQIESGYHLVFSELITGNGVSTQFTLTGAVTNATFISGGWNSSNVLGSLESDITDLNGKPIYDAGVLSYFTRHRIYVNSISGAATVNLDYPPQNGQVAKVWYWYDVATTDRIDNYYRDDFVAKMEQVDGDLSTNIVANPVNFNGILSASDDTVQKSLDTIDDVAIKKTEVASISSYLQTQIAQLSGNSISQATQISSISAVVNNIDANYVNITGDVMVGNLNVPTLDITAYASFTPQTSGSVPWQEGRVFYCDEDKTLCYFNDNNQVKVNIGQEQIIRVVNKTGTPILNGSVVYISGAQGNRPTIHLADANFDSSHKVIGMTTCDIPDNNNGYVTTEGLVRDVDTNLYPEGTELWLSETLGQYTNVEPSAPSHKVKIGYVLKQGLTDGIIFIKIDTGLDLEGLHDVNISGSSNGDILVKNGSVWDNSKNINDYTTIVQTSEISSGLQTQILSRSLTGHNHTVADVSGFAEGVDDRVANLLVAGSNINISYSDIGDTLTISATISGASSLQQGIVTCDISSAVYTVSHSNVDINYSFPTISLVTPASGSTLFIQSIIDRSQTQFKVVLSEVPATTGYYITWHLPSTNSSLDGIPVVNVAITNIPSYTTTVSGSYNITLSESVVYADNDNTIVLPSSPTTNESHWIVNTYTSDITIDGNGKDISVDGINNSTLLLSPDSSLHIHFNASKNKWYVI